MKLEIAISVVGILSLTALIVAVTLNSKRSGDIDEIRREIDQLKLKTDQTDATVLSLSRTVNDLSARKTVQFGQSESQTFTQFADLRNLVAGEPTDEFTVVDLPPATGRPESVPNAGIRVNTPGTYLVEYSAQLQIVNINNDYFGGQLAFLQTNIKNQEFATSSTSTVTDNREHQVTGSLTGSAVIDLVQDEVVSLSLKQNLFLTRQVDREPDDTDPGRAESKTLVNSRRYSYIRLTRI